MKKHIPIFMTFVLLCLCMYGCSANKSKQEQAAKIAFEEHMNDTHGASINSYDYLKVESDGRCIANVKVTTTSGTDFNYQETAETLRLDKNCNIEYCSLCSIERLGHKSEEPSDKYQNYILQKTEQLTGFVISLEMNNYREREVTANGQTYVDIFAFINIEEMAGTKIYTSTVFQLYALINPDNEEDLYIRITGNSTGEIYLYDNTSFLPEAIDNDTNQNSEPQDTDSSSSSEPQGERTQFHGNATISNDWIYYADNSGLCRIKTDGSDKQVVINEDYVQSIEVKDDWIYYKNISGLYRIKTNGNDKQQIYAGNLSSFTVDQDWIYCSYTWHSEQDSNVIFRIKTDGSNKQKILDWHESEKMVVADEWLYFGNLYRIHTDGTDLQELQSTSLYIRKTVVDDWLYSTKSAGYGIKRTKIDGSEEQILTDHIVNTYVIADDWVYYSNADDASKLYRMKKDGTENQLFLDESAEYFCVDGDWVYYWNWDNTNLELNLFHIKTDGSQKELICKA